MTGRSLVPDLPLFRDEAEVALRMFKRLRLPDVIGTPTMAEACGPWFFPVVEAVFGSYDPQTHQRMIQEFFELIPKGNAKSTGLGAIMVIAMILSRRPRAEYLLIAPTKKIADTAFLQAEGMIDLDPALRRAFKSRKLVRQLINLTNGASLEIKAADTDVITGSKAVGTAIDETHEFAKHRNAASVFIELRGALAKRPDGFLIQITTQSKEQPAGVFAEELKRARAVRDGKLSLPLLPVLYELPESLGKDAWRKRKYWHFVNPNLGRSVSEEFLVRELAAADLAGDAKLVLFASQHFNVEIGVALKTDGWVGADHWEACVDEKVTLETIKARCSVVVVGIDGGGLKDLLGLVVLGREDDTGHWLMWAHAWAHPSVLKYYPEIAQALLDYIKDGDVTLVKVVGEDVEAVGQIVEDLDEAGVLPVDHPAVGVDQVGIQDIVEELVARNIDVKRIVGIPQGWRLTNAIKTTERKLAAGKLRHSKSRLMNWVLGNAKVEPRGNAILITKQGSGNAKIDPLMAAFDAVAVIGMNPEDTRSVFDRMESDGEEAQESANEPQDDAVDPRILADPKHPLWEEHRRRFEESLPSFREDD